MIATIIDGRAWATVLAGEEYAATIR